MNVICTWEDFRQKPWPCKNKAESIFMWLTLDCPNVCMFVLFLHVLLGTTSESHLGWFRLKSVRFSGFPWLQGNRSQQEGPFGQEHCAVRLCAVWIDDKLQQFPRMWWGAHLCLSQWGTLYPESAPNPSKHLECTLAPIETLWIFFSHCFRNVDLKESNIVCFPPESERAWVTTWVDVMNWFASLAK